MNFNGYDITETNNGIIIDGVRDFDPVHTFECGQCFRWIRQQDGSYTGVVKDKAIRVKYAGGRLEMQGAAVQDFQELWYNYLDLGTDYAGIKAQLEKDENLWKAVRFGGGMRILKQDLWETTISFIISSNNHIPRIMRIVNSIAGEYGDVAELEGERLHTFPSAGKLAASSLERLDVCRGGYRCKFIHGTAIAVSNKAVNLDGLASMSTDEARAELMKLPGVGPKVADCILLYSGTRQDVFPTDVWVKRVMEELYFKRPAGFREIQEFAAQSFGSLMGYAQQYLFYYARLNKIGTK
jgi:N-glycosylase/DNA lyase